MSRCEKYSQVELAGFSDQTWVGPEGEVLDSQLPGVGNPIDGGTNVTIKRERKQQGLRRRF